MRRSGPEDARKHLFLTAFVVLALIGGAIRLLPTSVAAAAAGLQQLDGLLGEMTAGTATPPRASVGPSLRARFGRLPRSPVFYGIVVAVIAGVAGAVARRSRRPAAYGICSACHGRDLVDWTLNHVEGTKLFVTAAGAELAAPDRRRARPRLVRRLEAKRRVRARSTSAATSASSCSASSSMGACLFVGGCPTRIIIRTGYGDVALH